MLRKIFNPYEEYKIKEKTRLIIYDEKSKIRVKDEIINSKEYVEVIVEDSYNKSDLKYKYQIIDKNGKWKDFFSKYYYIFKTNPKELLKNFKFEKKDIEKIGDLKDFTDNEINYFFKNLLLKFYNFSLREPSHEKVLKVSYFLESIPYDLICSRNVISHCYMQMKIMNYIAKVDLEKKILSAGKEDIIGLINYIESNFLVSSCEESLGLKTGYLVAIGNIYSIFDRNESYEKYQEALSLGSGYIENFLTIDPLSTYYKSINEDNKSYEIIDKNDKESIIGDGKGFVNVCFSTDIKYFKMFAINWAQANLNYKRIIFNFGVVTNSEEEYLHCINCYNSILSSISNLLEMDEPKNYRFFRIKSSITNKTLYACARFYLAYHLIEKYDGDIFISDIDQLVIDDLETYLLNAPIGDFNVYQPMMRGLYKLLPGRSHLAGNIYIRNNIEGQRYCKILTNYVGMGLQEDFSWILDQNATRYASEYFEIGDIFVFGERPLKQYPNLKRTLRKQI